MQEIDPSEASAEQLKHIISVLEYQAKRATFFPSEQSLRWFIRKHQQRLVEADALLMMRGAWHVHSGRLDEEVVAIGREEARASKASGAADNQAR